MLILLYVQTWLCHVYCDRECLCYFLESGYGPDIGKRLGARGKRYGAMGIHNVFSKAL